MECVCMFILFPTSSSSYINDRIDNWVKKISFIRFVKMMCVCVCMSFMMLMMVKKKTRDVFFFLVSDGRQEISITEYFCFGTFYLAVNIVLMCVLSATKTTVTTTTSNQINTLFRLTLIERKKNKKKKKKQKVPVGINRTRRYPQKNE